MNRYRSKTLTTWLAVFGGAVGLHRFYLHGLRDHWGWIHVPPTLIGLIGVQRMDALGQDDHLAWLLIPLLGLSLSVAMLAAIVHGLTPDDTWDARHNAGLPRRRTGWGAVIGVIVALMVGGVVLIGTIAFSGQRFFEWQMERAAASVVLHAGRDLRKPMDLRPWLGANRSDARWHREDLQRRHGGKDAVLCRA
jgi:hypothetical protein